MQPPEPFQHSKVLMLKRRNFIIIFLLTVVCGGLAFTARAQKTGEANDPLKPYTACTFDDGMVIERVRRIKGVKGRAVDTADGQKEVSRTNSYEVLVGYPKTDTFVSIRPERSDPAFYERDKKNVIESLKLFMLNSKGLTSDKLIEAAYNNFQGYGIHRNTVESYSTTGMYVLFNDEDETITTFYFFNSNPKNRNFQTIEQWQEIKEKLLKTYTGCINTNSNR